MLPLLVGAAIVGVIVLGHKKPKTFEHSAPTNPARDVPANGSPAAAANPVNTTVTSDVSGQSPASVTTETTTETGAVTTDTSTPSQPSGTAPLQAMPADPTVQTAPPAPTVSPFRVASLQTALKAQYGGSPSPTDTNNFYGGEQRRGTVVV